MSATGLYGSIYEQLRTYADRLDRALVSLRNPSRDARDRARLEIASLLREVTDKNSTNPTARLVAVILRQELRDLYGQKLDECDSLANVLEQRAPDKAELNQLEQIAIALDKECCVTLGRTKGKR